MKSLSILSIFLLTLLSSHLHLIAAEQAEGDDDANGNGNEVEVCDNAVIEVTSVSVLCDSPGTYYYGSDKYRNSDTCLPGDKAKVEVEYYIQDASTIQSAGTSPLVTLEVDGGWLMDDKVLLENADLCSNSKSLSYKSCPSEGKYRIKSQFYWSENSSYYDSTFVPTASVGFKSNKNTYGYDYGGANTYLCTDGTFVTWTEGVAKSYANTVANFFRTFGIFLITAFCMGSFIWFLAVRPTSLSDAKSKLPIPAFLKKDNAMDEFDFQKIQTARNRDLVDF